MSLRVATFNARHGRPASGFASTHALVASVASLEADVVGLQEVERRVVRSLFADQPARIGLGTGTSPLYAPVRRVALTGTDGVALCVRGSVGERRTVRFRGLDGRQDRCALFAAVSFPGRAEPELSVAVTHLQDHAPHALDQLGALLAAFADWPAPRLLLGDLNLSPLDAAPLLEAAGFTLAGGGPSSPADAPVLRIDHVAVAGLVIGAVEVAALPVSDHRAVTAEVCAP